MSLKISEKLYNEVIEHCRREYPKEACGMFGGTQGNVTQVYAMRNTEESPISYQMDPKEQLQVMKKMSVASEDMIAIYHSHTATDAYPSPVDVKLSISPDVSYVLVSLKDQQAPAMRSYRIEDGAISEECLEVV